MLFWGKGGLESQRTRNSQFCAGYGYALLIKTDFERDNIAETYAWTLILSSSTLPFTQCKR